MGIIFFVCILLILVGIHELGHYLMAKRAGMEVTEFGFGLPPKIWGKKWKGTLWTLNLLPLGGFVTVRGADDFKLSKKNSKDPLNYHSKTWWQKFWFISGGVIMNFLFAIFVLTFLYTIGTTALPGTDIYKKNYIFNGVVVEDFVEGSNAQSLLQQKDLITQIKGNDIHNIADFNSIILANPSRFIKLTIDRDGVIFDTNVFINSHGKIGILYSIDAEEKEVQLNIFKAFFVSVYNVYEFFVLTTRSIGTMISSTSLEGVAGPVGIVKVAGGVLELGFKEVLKFMALLSMSLGVLNLLPIPALDGGRLLFLLLEAVFQKKLPSKVEAFIHGFGFAFLITIMVLVTIKDVQRFW